MLPHPILMDTLWSDRNRMVLREAARQERLDQIDETPAARPLPLPHRAARKLIVLALDIGLRIINAPSLPA